MCYVHIPAFYFPVPCLAKKRVFSFPFHLTFLLLIKRYNNRHMKSAPMNKFTQQFLVSPYFFTLSYYSGSVNGIDFMGFNELEVNSCSSSYVVAGVYVVWKRIVAISYYL